MSRIIYATWDKLLFASVFSGVVAAPVAAGVVVVD